LRSKYYVVKCSKFIDEVIKSGNSDLESLSLSDGIDKDSSLGVGVKWISTHLLPMIEDALGEGTAGSGSTESLSETEGFADGKVSLHVDEGSSRNRLFTDDNSSSKGEALIDSTDGIFRALNFDQEDGLLEAGG